MASCCHGNMRRGGEGVPRDFLVRSGPADGPHADTEELGDLGEAATFVVAHPAHFRTLRLRKGRGAASDTSPLPGGIEALARTLSDAFALKLRDGGEDMEGQATGGRRGVDVLGQRPKPASALLDRFHDIEKVPQRAGEAVVLGDNDHVAGPQMIEEAVKLRALPHRAADLVGEDALGTGCRQGVGLGIEKLVVCRDAGITEDHAPS